MGPTTAVLVIAMASYLATAEDVNVRFCVTSEPAMTKCEAMKRAFADASLGNIGCVKADDRYQCMKKIKAGEAEVMRVDDTDIYAAGKYFGLIPILKESNSLSANDGLFLYKAVIVIRKNSSITSLEGLRQKKSCHTGVGRTVGWTVPVANLQARKLITIQDCDNTVKNVANYFRESCAPGAFDAKNDLDRDNPKKVCKICGNPQCPSDDTFSGYTGSVQCLLQKRGEVAFAKHSTIDELARGSATIRKDDFRLLCPDGRIVLVDEWESCSWATRPTDAIVTSPTLSRAKIDKLRDIFENGARQFNRPGSFQMFNSTGGTDLLFTDGTKRLLGVSETNYIAYLGDGYLNTLENYVKCDFTNRWCVVSDAEANKCLQMSAAFAAGRISSQMTCVRAESHRECMEKIEAGDADLVTLDGGDVYTGGKYHKLVPLMAENYQNTNDTSYWAVAVTKKSNTGVSFTNLKGKTSCHTGIMKTSGWNIPIGTLIEKGAIKSSSTRCGIIGEVGKFFSKSCVPGALDTKYNPTGNNPSNLCELCGGKQFCQRDSSNKYYSYKGAFRCLVEKNADVAFVKHSTVQSYTDGNLNEDWAKTLNSADFELLCPDGSRASVDKWRQCNLAKVPSHTVVTSGTKTASERRHYSTILRKGQLKFGKNSDVFQMFATYEGKDAIFDDSTTSLSVVPQDKQDYTTWLGNEYVGASAALDKTACTSGGHGLDIVHTVMAVLVLVNLM
ncbi:melanotransferrin-like [Haliotis cracherodii]|uniref:melanotransferrin-like n=1 Tax=Haliotis cracherodii TaxID=6455 RepID=UPI0039EA7978